ncbi:hypothetical protein ACGFSB_26295 [Streptomyces sp. NPDC048441]|uniref:hypothetical protein n=1 Tax=Streptomyces sp. NPDC048441 TaxID=3365552 RepID=UPI00371F9273
MSVVGIGLHLFFAPSREEVQWAADSTDSDEHQLTLLLALKSYQRNWKDLAFYRPPKQTKYVHIDALFGEPGTKGKVGVITAYCRGVQKCPSWVNS